MKQIELKAKERIDDLQRNGLRIIQDPERFCFGMDAVLLSGFASAREGDEVLDMGTGTGILPLLLSAKTQAAHFTALEIQEDSADMARRSVALNDLEEKIRVVQGDIKEVRELLGASRFDVVTCNPPYMIGSHGVENPDSAKAIARHEILCTFEDVAAGAAAVLKPGGHFYLVHRPFRLAELICTLSRYKLEPKRMRLVYPYVDREPNMVLLEAVRGGKSRLEVEKPLILQDPDGSYTEEIKRDYGF
ncbi:MAG: tRNA1(Val) (adenine(37)-N6)-methyltransferase [Lachnospiraceae bacterium]|nr:tRNA1(Val) (adenine(37)-N6)-methyltransferase [Lachnospiraceae bacterium]